ncbi:pentapeptide repeat-containing protein [Streptomyces sp. SMS_SU21]|uniref:pentapeptide repeat-containing protein n=1 Tax=Streptomyces sp. SMS_SU21 TaxID=2069440 RepID=UPI0011B47E68|nr:pentapeptide repeat-containing protein [Streptomyces sp. SMS_SU21]MCA2200839.1 pentapeptide repeat-containing protein [Streptomyces sp. SMS_SU21]
MKRKVKRTALGTVLALVVIGYALLLWRGPWWIDGDHLRTENLQPADGVVITGIRTALVALGAGAVATFGLYYTHRNHQLAQRQYEQGHAQFLLAQDQFVHAQAQFAHTQAKDREQTELTREGQVTERYVEAIKLLSAENLTQRLGGIYALERIMWDSDKDRSTAVDVLAAFIRERAAIGAADGLVGPDGRRRPQEDVQAALTVLGRRRTHEEKIDVINLSHTDLRGADLTDAMLDHVDLGDCLLQQASFYRASLRCADFFDSDLTEAHLGDARIGGAIFAHADMTGASLWKAEGDDVDFTSADMGRVTLVRCTLPNSLFRHASLTQAEIDDTILRGADFRNADLRTTKGLTSDILESVIYDDGTLLPESLARSGKAEG